MEGLGMIDDLPAQPEASHISALLTAHKTILGLLA
jgi:hypothetical protein